MGQKNWRQAFSGFVIWRAEKWGRTWRRKLSQGKKKVCSYFLFYGGRKHIMSVCWWWANKEGGNTNTGGSGLLELNRWMGRRDKKWSKMEENASIPKDRRENAWIRIIENTEIWWLNLEMFSFDFIYFLHEIRSKVINWEWEWTGGVGNLKRKEKL